MTKIISTSVVKPRVYYLDFARGLAVFFMIMQHTILMHEYDAGEGDGLLGNVFLLLGTAPAAPVFMLIMGVFIARAKGGALALLWRGVKLFALGYVLNLLRFTLPLLLVQTSGVSLPPTESPGYLFWMVDILQLAGLSFIFAAPLKTLSGRRWVFPAIITAVLFVSPLLWGSCPNFPLFAPLWGTAPIIEFPFFPWVIYPLLGMWLSPVLFSLPEEPKQRRQILLTGVLLMTVGALSYEHLVPGDYHRSGAGVHFAIIGFVCVWLVACNSVTQRVDCTHTFFKTIFFWSRQVTGIYFIQWILFGWSMLVWNPNSMSGYGATVVGLGVLVITHWIMRQKRCQKLFAWI